MYQENTEDFEYYLKTLKEKWKKSILTTEELSEEINLSINTIRKRVKENRNIPRYKKTSEGKGGRFLFPIREVARYLANDLHEIN